MACGELRRFSKGPYVMGRYDPVSVLLVIGALIMIVVGICVPQKWDLGSPSVVLAFFAFVASVLYACRGHRLGIMGQRSTRPQVEVGSCVVNPNKRGIYAVCKNAGLGPAINVKVHVATIRLTDGTEESGVPRDHGSTKQQEALFRRLREQRPWFHLECSSEWRDVEITSIQAGGGYGVELEAVTCEQLERWPTWKEWQQVIREHEDKQIRENLSRAARHHLAATRHPGVAKELPLKDGDHAKIDAWLRKGGMVSPIAFKLSYEDACGRNYESLSILLDGFVVTWLMDVPWKERIKHLLCPLGSSGDIIHN